MRFLTLLIAAIVLTTAWAADASAQCAVTRHFYNNSDYTWTISVKAGCGGLPYCAIRPHSTGKIQYNPVPLVPIVVKSPIYSAGFLVQFCHIVHQGNTGAIAVNDPADGDIQTCGGPGWPCPRPFKSKKRQK
jgi:hypothetical protein